MTKNRMLKTVLTERVKNSAPGTRFATEKELCAEFSVSRMTVNKVVCELVKEGFLERFPIRGTFVKQRASRRCAVVFDSEAEFGVFGQKAMFMKNFISECRKRNFDYSVFENVDTEEDCLLVRKSLLETSCDGVIVSSRKFAFGAGNYLQGIPVPAVGLYPYKWLKRCVSFDRGWVARAGKKLLEAGCTRAAFIAFAVNWQDFGNESILLHYFRELHALAPRAFLKKDLFESELSPRGGYRSAERFLDSLSGGERCGIIVLDAILTQGVISAVLQRGLRPMKDVMIVSQANRGASLAEFSLPVWTFEADIAEQAERVLEVMEMKRAGSDAAIHETIPMIFKDIPSDN